MDVHPRISIIIVSWNTRDLLSQCIQSVIDGLGKFPYEIIVVDNASSDGSAEMIKNTFAGDPHIHLIQNRTNVGFARANNQALKKASGETIALVNSDITLTDDALLRISNYIDAHPRAGVVSCNLVGTDGASQSIHRRFPTLPIIFWTQTWAGRWLDHRVLRSHYSRHYRLKDIPRKGVAIIDQAAGALMVTRRSTVEKIGGLFDERFPIYGNDVDFCRRIWKAGHEVHVLYDVSVVHKGSASLMKMRPDTRETMQQQWFHDYFRLHEPRWKGLLLRLMIPCQSASELGFQFKDTGECD